jgi:thiol-disulfide isomerase/thioredoxin
MKTSPIASAAFFVKIAPVCLLILASAAVAEESKATLEIKSISPTSPAQLKAGDRLTIAVEYRNPEARSVQIWARPYTGGRTTPGYRAHGSSAYTDTAGRIEGWFFFEQPTTVDEVRVEMVERAAGSDRKVLATISQPITATWTGTRAPVAATQPATAPASSPGARVGEPLDLKFTAVDGREVDLAKLRGKVVLIDFWATWCGPCIGELPHVLEAYRKFHDKGFEIVGISFDQDKAALERLTKERGMTWPQYFDGKGWKNDFGVKYGIRGIPAMWLIDQQGKVATTNGRQDLAGQVEKLLAGPSAASSPAAPSPTAPAAAAAKDAPVALKISETLLRKSGVFGFPQEQARVFCDTPELRFSVWSNGEYLYAQAVLWKDDDAALGKTGDGRAIGDTSELMLDVDADGTRTKDVDRSYMLNPWPALTGLHYSICLGGGATTHIKKDTSGRGAIRYLQFPDGRKVRVDSYVIPFAEISRKVADKVRLCFYGSSTKPPLTVNSAGHEASGRTYYGYNVPLTSYHDYVLAQGAVLPLDSVPDGRNDPSLVAPRHREPRPQIGAVAPEISAKDWLNASAAPTLAALRGQVVLVEFWATWCGPCIQSIPHLNALQKKYADRGFKLVSLTEQDRNGIESFTRRTPMNYLIGTEGEATFDRYGVSGIPAAFVVDKTGKIAWEGNSGDAALEGAIEAALGRN